MLTLGLTPGALEFEDMGAEKEVLGFVLQSWQCLSKTNDKGRLGNDFARLKFKNTAGRLILEERVVEIMYHR